MKALFALFLTLVFFSPLAVGIEQVKPSQLPTLLNAGMATDDLTMVWDTSAERLKKLSIAQLDLRYVNQGDAASGTLSSVGISVPNIFSLANSPLTSDGTITIGLASQLANLVWASPDGSSGSPTFRSLVSDDLPNLSAAKITSGTLAVARGGTNSGAALSNNRVMQSSSGAIVEASAITAARALISDANGIPTHSTASSAELAHLVGVSSGIQSQLDGKIATGGAAPVLTQCEIRLRTGANWGSTNTKIRRFSVVDLNTCSSGSLSLTQSAADGDSITVNTSGLYNIYYNDAATSAANFGVSRNASGADLTTNVYDLGDATKKIMYSTAGAGSEHVAMSRTIWLSATDVIRAHGEAIGTTNPHVMFGIVRVY